MLHSVDGGVCWMWDRVGLNYGPDASNAQKWKHKTTKSDNIAAEHINWSDG